jgi:hypothetical protein
LVIIHLAYRGTDRRITLRCILKKKVIMIGKRNIRLLPLPESQVLTEGFAKTTLFRLALCKSMGVMGGVGQYIHFCSLFL